MERVKLSESFQMLTARVNGMGNMIGLDPSFNVTNLRETSSFQLAQSKIYSASSKIQLVCSLNHLKLE